MTLDPDAAREALHGLLEEAGPPAAAGFPLAVGARRLTAAQVLQHLAPFLTERRRARIEAVVAERTRAVVPVVEGLINVGNVSAVMRTAEALGCQDLHVVTGDDAFKQSARTSQGAEKWLDVRTWSAPEACAAHLRAAGYAVVAMHLSEEAVPIGEIDFAQKTALVFGNEQGGVSEAMLAAADQHGVVPQAGFTQSLNVSVAAAVALYHARQARREQGSDLTATEQEALRARFYLHSVNEAEAVLRRVLEEA